MGLLNQFVRGWQKVPVSWRQGLVNSPLAPVARRLVNRFYPQGPQVFELAPPLAGYRMRLHWQTHKAYVFGTYEPPVTQTILQAVESGWTVLDIGAHIGYFTLLLAERVGPHGKVIAFEAFPDVFSVLEENVRLNACGNVVLENKAVGAEAGRVVLGRVDHDPLPSTAVVGGGHPVSEVEAVGLDHYLGSRLDRISFVKIDVEGAEDAALEGMQETLRRDRPLLLIEIHGFDAYGEQHPALRRLRQLGYATRCLDGPGAQVHVLAEGDPKLLLTQGARSAL